MNSAQHYFLVYQDYLELCKPRVVLVMLLTALVGMMLAHAHVPTLSCIIFTTAGIACCAASAAVINHCVDKHIDLLMARTCHRPVATERISLQQACLFATILGVIGLGILLIKVNALTASLTALTIIGYAGFYTGYLKRITPQNIVIGGLAGAAPPLLGWTAVANHLDPHALLLVLIIFLWTPPHFWALCLYRLNEYKNAAIPMLPVTHGEDFAHWHIVLYTLLLINATLLPFVVGMSGLIYLIGIIILNGYFLYYVMRLYRFKNKACAIQVFHFSIKYLLGLFILLLIDCIRFF